MRSKAALFSTICCGVLVMAGCANGIVGTVASVALQAAGLKGDLPTPPKLLPLRIHAGFNLNANDEGSGVAVVTRIYKLRDAGAFMSAPYAAFGSATREREALGDTLMEVREVVLTPGQKIESKERMSAEMAYLGVVALFRAPASERWRVAFSKGDVDEAGITIGVHRCAMSVTEGKVYGMNAAQLALLSPANCNEYRRGTVGPSEQPDENTWREAN